MATNPLLRYGPPRQIACTLGISGEFPNYTSGSAYTGTVSINGAQGATRVELVPPGTDANGGAYIPLVNGDFAAGSTSWSVQTQTTSPGFSFQSGAGRSGNGFLRWQCSGPMGNNDADVVVNTALVRTTERTTTGRFWAKCTAIGATSETVYAQVAVQMQVFADAAGTQLLGSYLLGFLRFFEVLDWRPVVSSCPTLPGQYVRFSIWIGSGVAATLEFDDAEWDARGIPSGPVSPLALPSGFTIDTVTSPDRVRVQWPATAAPGASTLPNLGMETGDVNWLKGAGWAITNVAPVDAGSWSAKYTGLGQSNIVHETMAPVTAGTSITASCRVSKGNNRKDFGGGAVLLQWFDANTRIIGFNVGNVINTGSSAFQTSTVTATAPAGAAFVRLGASGSRDVKGRASDAVAVDGFTWNHTFALGGTGAGGSTAPTGPVDLTFRVTDSVGCSAVATRTIGQSTGSGLTYYSLLRFEGSFADETGLTWTTAGAPSTTTSQFRFGTASGQFAAGTGLTSPATVNVGTSTDFTVEFWIRRSGSAAANSPVFSIRDGGGTQIVAMRLGVVPDPVNAIWWGATSGTVNTGVVLPLNTWTHIAITRSGTFLRLFVDGSQVGSFIGSSNAVTNGTIRISRDDPFFGAGSGIPAFIDEFRLVIGTAIYTANFTPPAAQFPYP